MKRLAITCGAVLMFGLLWAGTASAKELILRPQVKIVSFADFRSCQPATIGSGPLDVEPVPSDLPCGSHAPAHYRGPFQGYFLTGSKNPCIDGRSVSISRDGQPLETGKFGEFDGQGARFEPPTSGSGWPPGHYEIISPQVVVHEMVVKGEQGRQTYPARIVCERLTLDLGSH